ncbi:Steroid 5-alpha-reductase DET2 [Tetrabaena socialis]|uniref:Steroid 5-alpha-reductase DET2 n=1 Tax=Tetrabaena socialis TaxID=47790 RepID=A0A2J8A874_9CHLO|nr:Steroid 5-alpha-reductase DET2 [Tetrabaena socialis]|eukprot:PNH08673.1 Steroid 5-alpha-reductase DET2 [Tetrabaena socialis]
MPRTGAQGKGCSAFQISDAIPGIGLCLAVYLLYAGLLPPGGRFSESLHKPLHRRNATQVRAVNVVLLLGWLLHYVYRGLITPLIMPYSSKTVAVGITLAGIFPNCLFAYLIAAQLACTVYPTDWARKPRFIIGVALYVLGTAINRWADLKLRAGRIARQKSGLGVRQVVQQQSGARQAVAGVDADGAGAGLLKEGLLQPGEGGTAGPASRQVSGGTTGPAAEPGAAQGLESRTQQPPQPGVQSHYFIPRSGLYELVSCPNYLGELLEWTGYALALWSWPALAWALFGASTFVPRSLTHHRWYRSHFGADYPAGRKALIPFVL